MNKRINKTRTILLLLSDKEINLTFSSKKHQLKINGINPKELTYKFVWSLTVSFTNPIDTNSSINNNNSSVNLLILRKSMTNSLISKAQHEKSMMFTRKVSVSRMKLQFDFQPQKEDSFIIDKDIVDYFLFILIIMNNELIIINIIIIIKKTKSRVFIHCFPLNIYCQITN